MRIALHIFMKDARRLRIEIAVTVALLAYLADLDRQRMDAVPGAPEAWLNLLLPLAWAFLLAMLVHQEPLVGDRQFWITRPYSRAALVAAKGLFALAFVHAPSLIANSVILISRGFNPLDAIASLLWKQALLAAGLTLPVAALAALTRNLAQFALAAFIAGVSRNSAGLVDCSGAGGMAIPHRRRPWCRGVAAVDSSGGRRYRHAIRVSPDSAGSSTGGRGSSARRGRLRVSAARTCIRVFALIRRFAVASLPGTATCPKT